MRTPQQSQQKAEIIHIVDQMEVVSRSQLNHLHNSLWQLLVCLGSGKRNHLSYLCHRVQNKIKIYSMHHRKPFQPSEKLWEHKEIDLVFLIGLNDSILRSMSVPDLFVVRFGNIDCTCCLWGTKPLTHFQKHKHLPLYYTSDSTFT